MLFSTLALTVVLGLPPQETKPVPPLDLLRAVPREALGFAQVRDLDGLRTALEENAFWKLYQAPETAELRAALEKGFQGDAGKDPSSGYEFLELLASVHGSLAMYALAPQAGTDPDLVALFDPGSPRQAFEKCYDEGLERDAKGKISSTSSYSGVELRVFEARPEEGAKAPDADATAPAPAKALHHEVWFDTGTFAGSCLSTDVERAIENAHAVIDRLRGKDAAEGISASPGLVAAREASARVGRVEFFVDLGQVMKLALDAASGEDEEGNRMAAAFGVFDLRWAHVSADIGTGETLFLDTAVALPEKGLLRSLCDTLGKLPLDAARALPKESQGVTLYSVDVMGLWKWVWEVVEAANPGQSAELQAQIAAGGQAMGGIDLEKDILGQLSGQVGSNQIEVPEVEIRTTHPELFPESEEAEGEGQQAAVPPPIPRSLLVGAAYWIGLRDARAFQATFEDLLDATGAGEQLETEEFQGHTLWVLPMPTGASISMGFTSTGLVLSPYPSALRSVLRMEGAASNDSALEHERFAKLFAENGEAGIFSATNTAGMLKLVTSALELYASRIPMIAGGGMTSGGEVPWGSLPPAEVIDRHLQGTATTSIGQRAGVLRMRFATR